MADLHGFAPEPAECTVGALEKYLFGCFPKEYCEPWDKCGLLVGDPAVKVRGVAIALDPNVKTIERASEQGCNVLLTHHPAYINPPDRLVARGTGSSDSARRLIAAIRGGVALIAMHTNLDRSPLAKQALIQAIGLDYAGGFIDDGSGYPEFGCIATVCEPGGLTLDELSARCAEASGRAPRTWGDRDGTVRRVGIANGSSNSFMSDIVGSDIDCVVTGELSYHNALEVASAGVGIIELGHDVSEAPLLECLEKAVKATEAFGACVRMMGPDLYWWQPRMVR